MKTLLLTAFIIVTAAPAFAGNCDYSSDTAADGSRCGGRSAEAREGGYDPYGRR